MQDLTIKVKLDRTQAKAAAAAHIEDAKAMGDATVQAIAKGKAAAEGAFRDEKGRFQARDGMLRATAKTADQTASSIGGIGAGLNSLASGFQVLSIGKRAFSEVAGAASSYLGILHSANLAGQAQVDKLLATKNLLRDISSMTGSKGGSTDAEVQKHLSIRTATGLDDAAAKAFSLEFSGSAEAKKGINISPEEFDKAKVAVGRFAAANSSGDAGAAGTYGNLAGLLLGFKKDVTAKGLVADVAGFNRILSLGVGDNPTLVRESAEQAGAVLNSEGTGIVKGPNDLAAIIATASMKSPKSAGNTVLQSVRALRDFEGPQGAFLKEAGMDPKDDLLTSYDKLFKQMEGAEKAGKPIDTFLADKGFKGIEDKFALQTMYTYRGYLNRFREEGKNSPTPDQAEADVNAKFKGDVALQTNVGEAKLDEAKMHNAMALQHARPLQLAAELSLQKKGEGSDSGYAGVVDWLRGTLTSGGGFFIPGGMSRQELGHKIRLEQEMNDLAGQQGVKIPDRPTVSSPLGGYSGSYYGWLVSGEMEQSYSQAMGTKGIGGGGSSGPADLAAKLAANTTAVERNTLEMAAARMQKPTMDPSPTKPPAKNPVVGGVPRR